jgi:DNA-3-methyladenine glycosylase I
VAETIPEVAIDPSPRDVLAIVTRAVFQAGVSWSQIARHWDAYEHAFSAFDPAIVATFDDTDVDRILAQPGVLRVPRKIRATIANAKALRGLLDSFGTFAGYADSFESYASLARDMRERFSFLGEMNVWYVLFRSGRPVPRFEPWVATIKGEHPRMREMVDLARSQGRSPERDS